MTLPIEPSPAQEEVEKLLERYNAPRPAYPFCRDDFAHEIVSKVPLLLQRLSVVEGECDVLRPLAAKEYEERAEMIEENARMREELEWQRKDCECTQAKNSFGGTFACGRCQRIREALSPRMP